MGSEKGRFRSFLLTCLKHFLADEREKAHALKRGVSYPPLVLDLEQAEERYRLEARVEADPESLYERRWCRRNPAFASLIVALVVTIIGGFAAVLGQLHQARLAEWATRNNAYVADMNLARQALEESNLGRARALPKRYDLAGKSENDLRGWEWRWLWQCSQTHERATLAGASNLVHSVTVSYLFAGSHETASVKVWSVPSLQLIGELQHEEPVTPTVGLLPRLSNLWRIPLAVALSLVPLPFGDLHLRCAKRAVTNSDPTARARKPNTLSRGFHEAPECRTPVKPARSIGKRRPKGNSSFPLNVRRAGTPSWFQKGSSDMEFG